MSKIRMRHLSLQKQISLLVGLLCLGLVCGAALGAAYIAQQRIREAVMSDAARTAATMASLLDRGMFERFREARNIAAMEPLRDIWAGDPAQIRQVIDQLQKSFPDYAWIGFATNDGIVKAATQGMLEGQSVQSRPWFQHGLKGPAVEDVHEAKLLAGLLGSTPNNEPFRFVDVATPVQDANGRIIGVLGAHLSWTWADEARQTLLDHSNRQEEALWILGSDGTMLLGPQVGQKPFSDEQVKRMHEAKQGAFEDNSRADQFLTGYAIASGYRDYPGFNWIIISRQPDSVAFAAAYGIVWTILGFGVAVALVGLVCAFFIARGVARPLWAITEAADKIGRDPNMTLLPRVEGSAEVTRLSAALRSLLRRAGAAEQRVIDASSQHEKSISALRQLAETDALSGLLNRRGFDAMGSEAFQQFHQHGRGFAVLVIDIDFFKKVNDTYGHAAGDEVIRTVGATMTKVLRSTDTIARFGGEEFIVLLREIGHDMIMGVAQDLRRAVEIAKISHEGQHLSVTASIGGAYARNSDRDIQDLIERADTALYRAKSAGRNRVSIDGLHLQLAAAAA
jgi:diguanylate cyclase (GGDEF)-like protein